MRSYKELKKEAQGDVWELGTPEEKEALDELDMISQRALGGDENAQLFLREIWDDEDWDSIKEKLETEGSVWYVWWMDGVRKLMEMELPD